MNMEELIARADVFTTNFLGKQLKKFQLEYETLKAINPGLVYAHISGYGLEGPESDRRAFDVTGWWARSGLMELARCAWSMFPREMPGVRMESGTPSTLFLKRANGKATSSRSLPVSLFGGTASRFTIMFP